MGAGFLGPDTGLFSSLFTFTLLNDARRGAPPARIRASVAVVGLLCFLIVPRGFHPARPRRQAALNAALDTVHPGNQERNTTYPEPSNLRKGAQQPSSYKNGIYYHSFRTTTAGLSSTTSSCRREAWPALRRSSSARPARRRTAISCGARTDRCSGGSVRGPGAHGPAPRRVAHR